MLNRLSEIDEIRKRQIDIYLSISPLMVLLGHPEDSLEVLQDGAGIAEDMGDIRRSYLYEEGK